MRKRLAEHPRLVEAVLVSGFFTLVAIIATWPLTIKPFSGFYGFGNDAWGGINTFGWVHDAAFGKGSVSFNPELQAPFGYALPVHAMQPADWLFSFLFGGIRQGIVVQNAQIFISFQLSGIFMYLLAKRVTGSRSAAVVAGFLFTFSPFHLALAQQYGALGSIQWLPLFGLALLNALERPSPRHSYLAGAALALIGLNSYYYLWFTVWFTALLLMGYVIAMLIRELRVERRLRLSRVRQFVSRWFFGGLRAGVVFAALFGPVALLTRQSIDSAERGTITHPLFEAVRYSARPWMLVLPPHDNPVLGRFTKDYVYRHLYSQPVYEQSIYIGVMLGVLCVIALLPRGRSSVPLRWPFVLAASVGFALMIGPYLPLERGYWANWGNPQDSATIPWIGRLIFEVSGAFRFFTRNFIFVSCALSALAAIGFARLARRVPSQSHRIALASLVIMLAGIEFTNAPPERWFSDKRPEWVVAVSSLERDAAVVDYPLSPVNSPRSLYYLFWQTKHRRTTVNPAATAPAMAFSASIAIPDESATGELLHSQGIDYAIIHTRLAPSTTPPYQPELPDDSLPPTVGSKNPWFEKMIETSDAIIYRIRPPS